MTQTKASTFSPDPLVGETERQFARIQIRRDLAEKWEAATAQTVAKLLDGEIGIESDTGRFKIGNGEDDWSKIWSIGTGTPARLFFRMIRRLRRIMSLVSCGFRRLQTSCGFCLRIVQA